MNWIFFLENCKNTQSNSIQFLYHFLKIVKKICVFLLSLNQFNTTACFIALIHLSINSFTADKQNLRINRKQAALHKILFLQNIARIANPVLCLRSLLLLLCTKVLNCLNAFQVHKFKHCAKFNSEI